MNSLPDDIVRGPAAPTGPAPTDPAPTGQALRIEALAGLVDGHAFIKLLALVPEPESPIGWAWAGAASLQYLHTEAPTLNDMYVSGAHRRQGIGRALTTWAIKWAEATDRPLYLSVRTDNAPALQLYRDLGFEPWQLDERPHDVNLLWMQLERLHAADDESVPFTLPRSVPEVL
jgi:GNAT superfamily N-acetyltransferase